MDFSYLWIRIEFWRKTSFWRGVIKRALTSRAFDKLTDKANHPFKPLSGDMFCETAAVTFLGAFKASLAPNPTFGDFPTMGTPHNPVSFWPRPLPDDRRWMISVDQPTHQIAEMLLLEHLKRVACVIYVKTGGTKSAVRGWNWPRLKNWQPH